MNTKDIFQSNFIRFMNKYHLDRNDIASKIDVPYATITSWQKGRTFPRPEKLDALAQLFRCTVADLLTDIDNKTEKTVTLPLYQNGVLISTITISDNGDWRAVIENNTIVIVKS